MYYSGTWYARYLTMSNAKTYDIKGALYNISQALSIDLALDERVYASYYPVFICTTFAISYGLSFATTVSLSLLYLDPPRRPSLVTAASVLGRRAGRVHETNDQLSTGPSMVVCVLQRWVSCSALFHGTINEVVNWTSSRRC